MAATEFYQNQTPLAGKEKRMSIPVEGGYRSIISTTLLDIRRRQAQVKALTEELEATAQAAASFQKVDLAEFHLDVDKLEFIERPKLPQPEPTVSLPEHVEVGSAE